MNVAYQLTPEIAVYAQQDSQVVESNIPVIDRKWTFVDSAGHGHFVDGPNIPTARWHSLPCSMGHGDDCTAEGFWECRSCGETIVPGTVMPDPVVIHGPTRFTVVLVTEDRNLLVEETYVCEAERFYKMMTAVKETMRSELKDRLHETKAETR